MARPRAKTRTTPIEKWAYHQAGHAVMAHSLDRTFDTLVLPQAEGRRRPPHPAFALIPVEPGRRDGERRGRNLREDQWAIALAGVVAVGIRTGRRSFRGADVDEVRRTAAPYAGSGEELAAYMKWLLLRTENRLKQAVWWRMIEVLAHELLSQGTLSGREARWLMQQSVPAARSTDDG
jgi:hypothetical protein